MLRALTDSHRQSNDKIVEILVRLEGQRETIIGHSNLLNNVNTRVNDIEKKLQVVENKAERTAQLQAEQEGGILAEVAVLATNDRKQNSEMAAIRLETHAQSMTLADHSGQMNAIQEEVGKLKDETKAQSETLKEQSTSLAGVQSDVKRILAAFQKIDSWKKAALILVMAAPGIWHYLQKFLEH